MIQKIKRYIYRTIVGKVSPIKYAKKIGAKFVSDCSPEKKKELDEKYRKLYGNTTGE